MQGKLTLRVLLNRVEKLVQFPKELLQIHYNGVPNYENFVQRIYEHWEKVIEQEKKTIPNYKAIEFDIINMMLLYGALQDAKAIVDQKNKN